MSNVNPEDINAFAGMLDKLNSIQEGRRVVDTEAGKLDRLAKNDMTAILSAFAETSGTSSALTLNEDVRQLGATTPAKNISPVLGEPEKDHPFDGYLVGEDADQDLPPEATKMMSQIAASDAAPEHKKAAIDALMAKYSKPDTEEVDEMIRKIGDKYRLYSKDGKKNLGTYDTRAGAEKREREVQYFKHAGESVEESVANEDSLSDIKKRLGDYLQDIKSGAKVDDKELSKKASKEDQLGPAIKTITTDDGKTIKIHGNEDDGFRLKINEKMHSARFKSFDEAQMACETYVAKRKSAMENQDYVEEK